MSASNDKLTLKQRRFVEALPLASSQTEAARLAGYSDAGNAAKVRASENVSKSNVKAALAEILDPAKYKAVMGIQERKQRLSKLAEPDPEHPDPMRAIDLLNRMDSIYVDRSESKNWNLNLDAAALAEIERQFTIEELRVIVAHKGKTAEAATSMLPAYTPQKTKTRRKAQ